jgi:hypothetical protein
VSHEDPSACDPQDTLHWKDPAQVAVAPDSIEADGRERRHESCYVRLAVAAMQDVRDLGMPADRLLQTGRVAVRVRNNEDVQLSVLLVTCPSWT